ncbi:NAD(P)H-binding protein [uncultured Trichococcus sp.]|uniref:NAD(P)H-binding protein n=1 Tax=uncultured Trichococcus sp. TaxID=189665 RepID=UPI002A188DC6|nr:NAD(P)H-binding protein [uncultured Trichococcus sp.]
MTKIVIIGATGSVGRVARRLFLEKTNDELTLFSRRPERLKPVDSTREIAVSGDVMNASDLDKVISGQDVVFASLTGNLGKMAKAIVESMKRVGVNRLIFITSMGIYNEIPATVGSSGNLRFNPVLQTYRDAADIIEASGLDYTIIRPGWFDSSNDTDYEITIKGEPFGGHDVSRKSIADLVVRLAADSTLYVRESVGINRPQ